MLLQMRAIFLLYFLYFATHVWGADLVVGQSKPEIEARTLDGTKTIRVSASQGAVTIINFWATWCEPCRAEMPALQAYYDRHKSQGLEVLAISMDEPRDLAKVRSVAQAFTFPVAIKSDTHYQSLGRIWRMPSTFVVDRQGVLQKNGHVGDAVVTLESLETLVTPLLHMPR
jgi:thiol-disulfide isomerase/thioredoxin